MIAHSLSVLPRGPGSIPNHGGVIQGIFPKLIAFCQPVLSQHGRKWLNLPSMTPHNLWIARRKAEVQPRRDDGWLKTKKEERKFSFRFETQEFLEEESEGEGESGVSRNSSNNNPRDVLNEAHASASALQPYEITYLTACLLFCRNI